MNVAAAELSATDYGVELKKTTDVPRRGETEGQFKKGSVAGVNAATMDIEEKESKATPRMRGSQKCKFSEITGCTGSNPPWLCKAFRDKTQEEGSRIIEDNKLCPFCHTAPRRFAIRGHIKPSQSAPSRSARSCTSSGRIT